MVDILVRIVGGSWDKSASNEMAFKMAGIFAIKDAIKKAEPIAIE
jgi:elongation factor G